MTNSSVRSALFALIVTLAATPLAAQGTKGSETPPPEPKTEGPWRLQNELESIGMPDWLKLSGTLRMRYEGISGQFRSAGRLRNADSIVFQRTILKTQADFDPVELTLELMDSRHYFGDHASALNTGNVNALDILQANANIEFGELAGGNHDLTVGRLTMDLGSRRLTARNRFRNTINSFNGVSWQWQDEDSHARVFWTMPTRRLPDALDSVVDNDIHFDDFDFDFQFFGAYFDFKPNDDHVLEVYALGLYEDTEFSRMRELGTIGGRFRRDPSRGNLDYQVESAIQFGDSRLSSSGADLNHLAWFTHASLGYTWDAECRPRVRIAIDFASGDDDPTDGDNGRFDTLFGARRFEYGPTGIYGAIARSNILSPEVRFECRPRSDMQLMVAARTVFLASDQDAWTTGRVQDASGDSGSFVGQQFETRWRWDLAPKSLRLEAGVAWLLAGEFQDDAPGGQGTDTFYGYVQLNWTF